MTPSLAGQHRPETQAKELEYWEKHGGVTEFDRHLSSYQKVFPFDSLDYSKHRILDVGSGPISIFENLAPNNAMVVPYDTLAAEYNRIAPVKKFKVIDEIPAARFDLITLFNMLDHMDEPAELLGLLRNYLAPQGRVWVFVHLDRPFSPEEHPQCFRLWQVNPLLSKFFLIESCGLIQEGNFVCAWWGIMRENNDSRAKLLSTAFMPKIFVQYSLFWGRRAAIKWMKVVGLRKMLPSHLRY